MGGGGGSSKRDNSTDRLREWDSDKGRGVENPKNFADVIYGMSLVLPGAAGLVARVHDRPGLLQRRHRLLQRRQVLLLELVRQVALDLAVRGGSIY